MIIEFLIAVTYFAEKMIELPGKGNKIEGGEALAPPSNVRGPLGIFKRWRPFPTILCAVVGSPDSHPTTTKLHDDPSS